ncbi:MAG: tetratricopeptide repeat protein [Chitinispirillia bacterium]|nr:tetratricopeptide repeat protein [Chitinispirillia bacterium]
MIKTVRAAVVCGVAVAAMFLTGCTSVHRVILPTIPVAQDLRNAQDTLSMELTGTRTKLLEEQVKLFDEQNKLLKEQNTNLIEELRVNNEMLRLMRADQSVNFNQLSGKVSAIERNLYENQTRLSRLDQQTSEVNRRLGQRMAAAEQAEVERRQQMEKLFEIAMSDFNAGRYDLAINGFQDFSKQYPETPQAVDAEYWAAESYFAKKEYATAEKAYMEFVKKYPESARLCAVFYKLGLSYENQEKTKSRDMVWGNLLQRCPDSQEAQAVTTQTGQ